MKDAPLRGPEDAYWAHEPGDLFAGLESSAAGLSESQAEARLRTYGPNRVRETEHLSALRLFLRQFESPLVLILVFGAGVSAFLREWVEALIIIVIVLGSTLLGFYQEYRASAAIAALRERLALTARVLRGGAVRQIVANAIVPGDVVELSAGNLVPGDGIILDARDFLVSESALTGESFPVEKQPGSVSKDAPLPKRTNCTFFGTSVRSGTAKVLIVHTGRRTIFGGLAERLLARAPETEFARGLRQFGYLLLRLMVVMVLFVLAVNQLLGRPVVESLLFAVALAVGLSPELLPAIVSVTLSAGARAMAARGVIVRRLEAIENLGAMDVLCTDKTGTLTEGDIIMAEAADCDGAASPTVREYAHINAALETGIDNPLDAAIVHDAERTGFSAAGFNKVDEIPYDFLRKRLTIVVARTETGTHEIVTKGAFANILEISSSVMENGKEAPLTAEARAALERFYKAKGIEGFRVLGLATKSVEPKPRYGHDDETSMCFQGFLLFFDPPKPQAKQTIADLAALGIGIKLITGDNRYVAAHVAAAVGLDSTAILTGGELAALRDEALWNRAERTQIFAEVDPQQKELIVRALQRRGHAVGYMGDGINDAAALHTADVGISVDTAVDVARQSADVVLLEPDLEVLCTGVRDGRKTFTNTLKYIGITTSANFGNMLSMAIATPVLPFLPLAATQILLNNFLSDLPSIAISTDNVDSSSVTRPQRWSIREVRRFMIIFGVVSSAFDGLTFLILLAGFRAGEALFQTAWFVVSLLTELAVVLVLRTRGPALRSRPSRLLFWTTATMAAAAVALPYVPPVAKTFAFVPLSLPLVASLVLIVAAYIATTELIKRRFFPGDAAKRAGITAGAA